MQLSEFVTTMQDVLEKFENDWLSEQDKNPENYPDSMEFDAWFEQLDIYVSEKLEQ